MLLNYLPRVSRKNDNSNNTPPIMMMSFIDKRKMLIPKPLYSITNSEIVEDLIEKPRIMLWGQPTWTVLHTLAEKVSDERFSEIRVGLLNIIYTIITLLPCPICAKHGKDFMDSVNFNTIVTKEHLKFLLFNFHNLVNDKKHYPIFLYESLVKYKSAITVNVIKNFMLFFTKNSGSIRLISDDLHRKRTTLELRKWFNDNLYFFSV